MGAQKDEQVHRALMVYKDTRNKAKVARDVGVSRQTIHRWANEGLLTDGEEWDAYLDRQEEMAMQMSKSQELAVRAEEVESYQDMVLPMIKKVVTKYTQYLQETGWQNLQPADLDKLLDRIARMENRGAELEKMHHDFMLRVMYVARELMGKADYELFVEKIKNISMEQLVDFDPDFNSAVK